jgi:hypothetical protein
MKTYTKEEIMQAVIQYMTTWKTGRPHLDEALQLTEMEEKIIGIIDLSLPEARYEPTILNAYVGKTYPKAATA